MYAREAATVTRWGVAYPGATVAGTIAAPMPREGDGGPASANDQANEAQPPAAVSRVALDKPIYTISVAAEILATHPRTLMMYEHLQLVVPQRTATNRRRYSQRDVLTLQAIQRLTRQHGLNLNGARYVIQLLRALADNDIPRPAELDDVDVAHTRL